ncbi:TonB-dependent receptor [Segatella copri]|uniref:TonB-dependent receptor n=1 Tax=Segatella copri TaxID=165179 RepID=A0AAW5I9S8_9BACT|nr:TonB-dependent receptor [Segatella copri]MCP9546225.1 TonB-dependent receptor [Segatella copri]MCP9548539.1 TonB-dependent receptor [Segatella copri]MCP9554695.1 TonB-dependent receptor [Segatella copri]MCP9569456.1 TonB-dependent receptor [Segatella copri]
MKRLFAIAMLGVVAGSAFATGETQDSVRVHHIQEVVVTSRLISRETIPSQTLGGEELKKLNSLSVADALRYFSGLQLKDYGGVGGIKTVNIRSMGTNHLGIFYDGIELGNAQNGQIDLGQFSLDNVEEISLYNGQRSAIFQPASDFGNAGSVYIRTKAPRFMMGRRYNLLVRAKYGSSDTFRFSSLWEQKLSEHISSSLSTSVLTSSGRYKFRYRRVTEDNTVAYDTTAVRHNGDIWAFRIEENVRGGIADGYWNVKAYTYHSERGIPGAIVSNVWRRGERQWDHNTFGQAVFQKSFGDKFSTKALAKCAYYVTRYVNNDETQIHVDNTYRQQEMYFSTSNVYEILSKWSVSMSYDFKWNKLNANMVDFAFPHRYSNFVSLATALTLLRIQAQASLVEQVVKDHVKYGASSSSRSTLTPAFFVNVYPFESKLLAVRAFAKKSFRMPTFNDLYYADMGNSKLNPESALQYDLGFVLNKDWKQGIVDHFRLQVDGYYNTVHDKIVAYPKGQQFRWTMLNLGKVHIKGVDAMAEVGLEPAKDWKVTARLQYTYQDARDVTDPNTSYYKDQIPYIPWHSGSAILGLSWREWDLSYSFIYSGERYSQQENILYNHLQPWYTHDMSVVYHARKWSARLDVNNIFSQDYDVILNYPMPKRNYMLTLEYNF